jgi:sterol desaturase/sphingolipid hydroxylase (fatty acid hydroxylase superfamily)
LKNLVRVCVSLGVLAGIIFLERKYPLRSERESKVRRTARNLTVAALSALTIHWLETPCVRPLAQIVAKRRWGLLKRVHLPRAIEICAALLLMDYTLYLWHVLTHRIPFLWRFHAVHHVDLDLDASTALRFHFGELVVSVPYRAVQILGIGIGIGALTLWQMFLSVSILFHHSNIRLPGRAEALLSCIFVTPGMHGIHHSSAPALASCNWSSGMAWWDRIHGTFSIDVPQEEVTIGGRGMNNEEQVTLPRLLIMPFNEPSAIRDFLASQETAKYVPCRAAVGDHNDSA